MVAVARAEIETVTVKERDGPLPSSAADRAQLEQLFANHHAVVWRTLRRRGLTEDEAADATQETFLIAAGRLSDIKAHAEQAFLIGTALRVAHTLHRKTMRWHLDEDMDQRASGARDAHDAHADVELCDMALSRLNAELAEVFVLYETQGLSSPEIASLLGIPLGSVASRLRRAREQFRNAVARIERAMQRSKP